MLVILAVQPHNWHFVCFWNATQNNTTKAYTLIRWSPLTLEKLVQVFTSLLQKESWERKLSDIKCGRFKSLKTIWSLYICFCFWVLWECQTDGPPNFARCRHREKDMMVWYKSWYVQNECTKSWHKMTNEDIIMKKVFLFFLWYNLSHMQIELVNEWIKNDRWKHAHKSMIDENILINPW